MRKLIYIATFALLVAGCAGTKEFLRGAGDAAGKNASGFIENLLTNPTPGGAVFSLGQYLGQIIAGGIGGVATVGAGVVAAKTVRSRREKKAKKLTAALPTAG